MAKRLGRPTKYSRELSEAAWDYVDNFREHGHEIPSVVGLCKVINRSRSIVYEWAEDKNKDFSDILAAINEHQELTLLNKGLNGEFNSNIAKLVLGKHGYKEVKEVEENISFAQVSDTPMNEDEWERKYTE